MLPCARHTTCPSSSCSHLRAITPEVHLTALCEASTPSCLPSQFPLVPSTLKIKLGTQARQPYMGGRGCEHVGRQPVNKGNALPEPAAHNTALRKYHRSHGLEAQRGLRSSTAGPSTQCMAELPQSHTTKQAPAQQRQPADGRICSYVQQKGVPLHALQPGPMLLQGLIPNPSPRPCCSCGAAPPIQNVADCQRALR